jgi:hypothetical protein
MCFVGETGVSAVSEHAASNNAVSTTENLRPCDFILPPLGESIIVGSFPFSAIVTADRHRTVSAVHLL